jgi:hypothetical protein
MIRRRERWYGGLSPTSDARRLMGWAGAPLFEATAAVVIGLVVGAVEPWAVLPWDRFLPWSMKVEVLVLPVLTGS